LAKSNSEARQAVQSGAIYIQEQQISDFQYNVSDVFLNDSILLIRKGKKNFRIVKK
jgi:tyrosyl-tRNA synthetase